MASLSRAYRVDLMIVRAVGCPVVCPTAGVMDGHPWLRGEKKILGCLCASKIHIVPLSGVPCAGSREPGFSSSDCQETMKLWVAPQPASPCTSCTVQYEYVSVTIRRRDTTFHTPGSSYNTLLGCHHPNSVVVALPADGLTSLQVPAVERPSVPVHGYMENMTRGEP